MGNWAINILGTGAHHNKDFPNDANKLVEKFVEELKATGQIVEVATFTHGGRDAFAPTPGYGMGTYYQPLKEEPCTKDIDAKIRDIFAEEMKTSANDLVNACDGTAEFTVQEATEAGEMAALMKVYKRINDEVLSK
jgi:hypothetical protein